MRLKPRLLTLTLLGLGLLGACSKEQFAGTPKAENLTADNVSVSQNQTCAGHTLVKPPVDILYIVDNSQSAAFLSSTIRQQVRQTVQSVSAEFNYRILIAPLFAVNGSAMGENALPVVTNDANGINQGTIISPESLDVSSFFASTSGATSEAGFDRAITVLNNYRGPGGVFRQGAHTIVVLVSNGDDTSVLNDSAGQISFNGTKYGQKVTAFNNMKTTLSAQQLRFFSVVANSTCQSGWKHGYAYRRMSCDLYASSGATDQQGRFTSGGCGLLAQGTNPDYPNDPSKSYYSIYTGITPDSYNLCNSDTSSLYAGVNSSIRQEVLDHYYNWWPITNDPGAVIDTDPSAIQVVKLKSNGQQEIIGASATNGYVYRGARYNQNTRFLPTAGEPQTGLFVELFGNARVQYPDCVFVRTQTPVETYEYVVVPTRPDFTKPFQILKNGVTVPTTHWTFENYQTNKNIKVNGSGAPLLRTGYFIKLASPYTYVSGDNMSTLYTPAPI